MKFKKVMPRLTKNFVREWTEEYCAKGVFYENVLQRIQRGEDIDISAVLNRDPREAVKEIAKEERAQAEGGEENGES